MLKVKLNLDPKDRITFRSEVAIPTPDGKPLRITFDFKYRDRVAMNAFLEENARLAVSLMDSFKDVSDHGSPEVVDQLVAHDVAAVRDMAVGWNVEDLPFDEETLQRFFTVYPGAAAAIGEHYRISLTRGRLGN